MDNISNRKRLSVRKNLGLSSSMRRLLLDTNIYGEIMLDDNRIEIADKLANDKNLIIYTNNIIKKELRNTPKNVHIGKINLRINLVTLFRNIAKKNIEITPRMLNIADFYYEAYREFGGSIGKAKIIDDFRIVACASCAGLDIVISQDVVSMLIENSVRAYKLVNNSNNLRTPEFMRYNDLKGMLS